MVRQWIKTNNRGSTMTAASRAAASAVKRAIVTANKRRTATSTPLLMNPRNVEKKFLDTILNGTNASYGNDGVVAANGIVCINAMALGPTSSNRVGRNVTVTSIFYRGIITFKTTNTGVISQATRTMIVQDKQANGSTPTIGDILLPTSPGVAQVYCPMNLLNSDRFRTLSDEVRLIFANGAIGTGATGADQANVCWIENYMRTNIRVTYNNNGLANHTDINTNSLLMCFVGALSKTNVGGPIFNGHVRIRYTDD